MGVARIQRATFVAVIAAESAVLLSFDPAAQATEHDEHQRVQFASAELAFAYACDLFERQILPGTGLVALVQDARRAGLTEPVMRSSGGFQYCLLLVASKARGFITLAHTIGSIGPTLAPGMLVGWRVRELVRDERPQPEIEWVGDIVSTLRPELLNGKWVGDRLFV